MSPSSSYRNPGSSQTIDYLIDSDPRITGLAAQRGALCARTDVAGIYCHTGPLDTDWTLMGSGPGSLVSNSSYSAVYNPYAPALGNSFQTLQAALTFARLNQPTQRRVQFDNTRSGTGVALTGPVGVTMTLKRNPSNPISFAADMVLSLIFIDGAANTPNIGQFPVTAVIDADTLEYTNAVGVAEAVFEGAWQVAGAAGVLNVDIPPDDYDFTGVELFAVPNGVALGIPVRILDGVHRWSNFRKIGGEVFITNLVNSPNPSPVKITRGISLEWGLSDGGDFPTLTNTGTAPFIDATLLAAGQSLQVRMAGTMGGAFPSIDFGASSGRLNTNFGQFGRWTTGVARCTNPLAELNITNIGPQNEIGVMTTNWVGLVTYGAQAGATVVGGGGSNVPRNRMQMFPFSIAQAAPIPSPAPAGIVNATGLGHNGSYFLAPPGPLGTQKLPMIRAVLPANGLSGTTPGALNSTGMSVEFNNVGAFPIDISADNAGETVMGVATPFRVQPGCCAVFRSDGVSNWRLVSYSPGRPSLPYTLDPLLLIDRTLTAGDTLPVTQDVLNTLILDLQSKGLIG